MKSYIVQLDFSTAFDSVGHSGALFILKSIGVGGSVLSICRKLDSDRRQRVVVDGAASEWIPIISGVPHVSVLGPLLFILYTSEMFELVENRLFAYADYSTLMAVVRKPADRPAVAGYINKDLARIQELCNHRCMILNPNKTKAFVVSPPRTVNLPMVTWYCLGFLSEHVPTSRSLAWSLTVSSPKTMCVILFPMSLRELVFWGWWNVYLWTPLCYYVAILHLFSQSLSIVLRCGGQLLNVTFTSGRLCPDPSFLLCRCFVWLGLVCRTRLIRTLIIVCSASFHLLLLEFNIPELWPQFIHWSLKYQGVERPNLMVFPNLMVKFNGQPFDASMSCVFLFPWHRYLWGFSHGPVLWVLIIMIIVNTTVTYELIPYSGHHRHI